MLCWFQTEWGVSLLPRNRIMLPQYIPSSAGSIQCSSNTNALLLPGVCYFIFTLQCIPGFSSLFLGHTHSPLIDIRSDMYESGSQQISTVLEFTLETRVGRESSGGQHYHPLHIYLYRPFTSIGNLTLHPLLLHPFLHFSPFRNTTVPSRRLKTIKRIEFWECTWVRVVVTCVFQYPSISKPTRINSLP